MTGPLVDVIIWPGSGSSPLGLTPFALYDDDDEFVEDGPKVAKWVCSTLGYPVMAVELTEEIIYGQFEQAISEFSSQVNEFNMREQMLSIQGHTTGSSISQKLIKGSPLPFVIQLSQMYGTEAGVGGEVPYHRGYITLRDGVQDYDLQDLWSNVSESGNRMEVRRIYHERSPAINRYFDPFSGAAGMGLGVQNLLGQFGWGNYSVASQYLLMPIYETLLRVQAIEFNDMIRRSQYGFEFKDNSIRLFPIPTPDDTGIQVWFEYTMMEDKFAANVGSPTTTGGGGVISDYSNAPYDFITYSLINDVGKRWIWKYTLSLCKIVLGGIRAKYDVIPIPNSEQRLDGLTLRQEGQQEIEQLMTQLRESLEEAGKQRQLEKAKENETNANEILRFVPTRIYIA